MRDLGSWIRALARPHSDPDRLTGANALASLHPGHQLSDADSEADTNEDACSDDTTADQTAADGSTCDAAADGAC